VVIPETQHLALIGAILLSVIMIICGGSFLTYGMILAFQMQNVQMNVHSSSSVSSISEKSDEDLSVALSWSERFVRLFCCLPRGSQETGQLWQKMLALSITVAVCFVCESLMQILSVIEQGSSWGGKHIADAIYTSIFYAFDLLALFTILAIFSRMVSSEVRKRITRDFPQSYRNTPGNSHRSLPRSSGRSSERSSERRHKEDAVEMGSISKGDDLKTWSFAGSPHAETNESPQKETDSQL